jgi:hypothetical protein
MAKKTKRTASKSTKTSKPATATTTARKAARTRAAQAPRSAKPARPAKPARAAKTPRAGKTAAKPRAARKATPRAKSLAVALAVQEPHFRPFLEWPHGPAIVAGTVAAAPPAAVPAAAAAALAFPAVGARAVPQPAIAVREAPGTGQLQLSIFDGTRQPIDPTLDLLVTINDGNQNLLHSGFHKGPHLAFVLPLQNNLADNFIVNVSASGFLQSGFSPVTPKPGLPAALDLMLLPKRSKFNFANAAWDTLKQTQPDWIALFSQGAASAQAAQDRYETLMAQRPDSLACLLNLATAMQAIVLPQLNPLAYFKELIWDATMAKDRFFGFADEALIRQLELAFAQGTFAPEPSPGIFHKGATRSFKQIQFGEANVQLTLHENDPHPTIGGVSCVNVEPDIDFFKDLGSHFLLEVIPGFFSLTDPIGVYVLRWIAGRSARVPDFNPPYTIVPA